MNMKVAKEILKWLLCVFLTFSTILTLFIVSEFVTFENFETFFNLTGENNQELKNYIKEMSKTYEETIIDSFNNRNISLEEDDLFYESYKEYPIGTAAYLGNLANNRGIGNVIIDSSVIGLLIGSVVYVIWRGKEKQNIKLVIILYILSIIILGFVQGVGQVAGENLNIFDYFVFPSEYIIAVTIIFAIIIIISLIKQKDIANKLNENLKEK